MEEIWKDIKGYEGLYQVSNLGRVKSLERILKHKTTYGGTYTVKGKTLIARCARGECKTAYGYKWKYADE